MSDTKPDSSLRTAIQNAVKLNYSEISTSVKAGTGSFPKAEDAIIAAFESHIAAMKPEKLGTKPEKLGTKPEFLRSTVQAWANEAYNSALNEYESNLLKGLK